MSLLLALTGGGGGVTGTAATSQAQTTVASGSAAPAAVDGSLSTSQAQTIAASGSFAVAGVSGAIATSQAQTVTGSGSASPAVVTGSLASSQAQTVSLAGNASPAAVSGTAASSQAQTISATGAMTSGIDGAITTSQAQTTNASGAVVNPEVAGFNGGFDMSRHRKVYIKRGKQYLIFNNNQEADSYLESEKAIEEAKKSSRGAARRKIKALKVVKPEIKQAPVLEDIQLLLSRFSVNIEVPLYELNNDIEALFALQSRLNELADEEDIELLLLS